MSTSNGQDAERQLTASCRGNVMDEHGHVPHQKVDLITPLVPLVQWFAPMVIAMVQFVCSMDFKVACAKRELTNAKFVV